MEGAVLTSSASSNGFRTHLRNAASVLCARTLPKQRRNELTASSSARHHTYPRVTPSKRAPIACRMEPLLCTQPPQSANYKNCEKVEEPNPTKLNGVYKLKGTLAREVANAWGCRVGPTDQAAPADRVQSLFNDIELYPTKSQVFEMLAWARQCARRKSFTLTFGEFCVFAAELRRCSRQSRLTPTNQPKSESPNWNVDRELREKDTVCKHVNGSETPPPCEVFLGGSCNPTTWRSDIAIPMLKKMGITYFNPQVEDWSTELMEVEYRAKAEARALLFVLDSETRAVAASVEAAQLAAEPRDLLLVLRPYSRHQTIGNEVISDQEYVELSRARATLQEAVERRGLPAFMDIPAALRCARAVLRGARTHPRLSLGHTIVKLKRAYDAAGGRTALLPRAKAIDALTDVTNVHRHVVETCLPPAETIDFETFCATVAELSSDPDGARARSRDSASVGASLRRAFRSLYARLAPSFSTSECQESSKQESVVDDSRVSCDRGADALRPSNGVHRAYNARLKAYGRKLGLYIPKKSGVNSMVGAGGTDGSGVSEVGSADAVLTPGTERRLERLPAMLGAPSHHVYLGGAFPSSESRPEEVLRRQGVTYVVARANDYSRMFSAGARRAAPPHPESPHHDKKARPSPPTHHHRDSSECSEAGASCASIDSEVTLREPTAAAPPTDRLSASDFYNVADDLTPQPFKGTYDEDLLLGSRILVFSMSSEAPCFATMVLAAHYMGLRPKNTVLIVQPMASHSPAHQYSDVAVKDYNRGRHYLTDLAGRSDVPVFDNVKDAMNCVLSRLRDTS